MKMSAVTLPSTFPTSTCGNRKAEDGKGIIDSLLRVETVFLSLAVYFGLFVYLSLIHI